MIIRSLVGFYYYFLGHQQFLELVKISLETLPKGKETIFTLETVSEVEVLEKFHVKSHRSN